jgi:hypothetical protein
MFYCVRSISDQANFVCGPRDGSLVCAGGMLPARQRPVRWPTSARKNVNQMFANNFFTKTINKFLINILRKLLEIKTFWHFFEKFW